MKFPSLSIHPLPPRLTMDEYADFVSETLRHGDPERIARQKEIEERIVLPFRIPEGLPAAAHPRGSPSGSVRGPATT